MIKLKRRIVSFLLLICLILSGIVYTSAYDFIDVPSNQWYTDSVNYVVSKGLMVGVSPGFFSPRATVTRAMVAQILYRLSGCPTPEGSNYYTDVVSGSWYSDAVNWAYENKIMTGYGKGLFGPSNAITREQLVTTLQRYTSDESIYSKTLLKGFKDYKSISNWALNSVSWGVHNNIISGSNNMLFPKNNASRAELATILMRYCQTILCASSRVNSSETLEVDETGIIASGNGFVSVAYAEETDKPLRVKVRKDEEYTVYVIEPYKQYTFCYPYGPGEYEVDIYINTTDARYAKVEKEIINVTEVEYNKSLLCSSTCYDLDRVSNAVDLIWDDSRSDYENCLEVYNYCTKSFNYDMERAKQVSNGYYPDLDYMFRNASGICLDFASLYASMLRYKGIPAQICIGYYSETDLCHAWCKVLIDDKWIVVDPTFGVAKYTGNLYFDIDEKSYSEYYENYKF